MSDEILKRLQWGPEGGFTSGSGSVYNGGTAVAATQRLAVEVSSLMADWEDTNETTEEARGTYGAQYTHAFNMRYAKGKFSALGYVDDVRSYLRSAVSGTPTVTTLPATPDVLLVATAIAASMTLTTQPNAAADGALAKMLAITLANSAANTTAVTCTVTGTSTAPGNPTLTEIVSFSAGTTTTSKVGGGSGALSVTLYTTNYFHTVTSITTSAQPTGDTVAVGGVDAFSEVYTADMGTSTLLSNTSEYFDGAAAWQLPGTVLEKLALDATFGKSFKLTADFFAQQKIPLVASTGSINPTAATGTHDTLQNLTDAVRPAMATNISRFYADPIGSTPGTTLIAGRITDYKFDIDNQVKPVKTGDPTDYPGKVGRAAYKLGCDFTLLFQSYSGTTTDPVELSQFLNKVSRTVRMAFGGPYLPCGQLSTQQGWPNALLDQTSKAGTYGIMIDMAGRYTKVGEKKVNGLIAHTYALGYETDLVNMGAPYVVTIITRKNPNM